MYNVGRLCVKIAGRDAGKKCVIVDVLEKNYVMIDGETRRRKCNVSHLEPLPQTVELKKGASHEEVVAVLKTVGIVIVEQKPKKAGPKPVKKRGGKPKAVQPAVKKVKPAKVPSVPVKTESVEQSAELKKASPVQKGIKKE